MEAEAILALERGDRAQATSILMKAYGSAVRSYCCRMLKDPMAAEDVAQIVFAQAYQDITTVLTRSALRLWLFAIARNRCADVLKMHRRWKARFALFADLPDIAGVHEAADDALSRCAVAEAISKGLECLTPRARTAVLLRYQSGLSYSEMGRVCNEHPATLQARVTRAMPTLRRYLEARGIVP